ncbi:MAG: TonB-dependent receptor [Alistipes sp.]|nr:TonB-dependent receptor [Candidatus Alistipes equi]
MKRKTIITLILTSLTLIAYADDIKGKVTDMNGKALAGASVYWADTNVGVATLLTGDFSIHMVRDHEQLVASFLGYENDTIRISDSKSDILFKLREGVELQSVTVDGGFHGNYVKEDGLLKTESISFAGLCKMACCSLAESFENSASVTVGFSDAITGAKQIKMLGLAGTYTQILDESRPIMRGIAAPYGLNYTPGMWLNSIQVSKGISSVTAGHEAITGQINLEHRKPSDHERMFLNLYFDSELRPEINLSSAMPVTKDSRLSTIILLHGSMDTKTHDKNNDNFCDMPKKRQASVANRWLYQFENGMQMRWGVKYVSDYRLGGMKNFRPGMMDSKEWMVANNIYGSEVKNNEVNAYLKMGCPVGKGIFNSTENDEKRNNIAFVFDFDHFTEQTYFGALRGYNGRQNMGNINMMYVHNFTYHSSLNSGITASLRRINENMDIASVGQENVTRLFNRTENEVGAYTEYTYTTKDKLSIVAGIRYDRNFFFKKHMLTPRAHLKWNMTKSTVVRASVGMGYRPTDIITDNIGIMATGRNIVFLGKDFADMNRMEKALTFGGSIAQTFSTVSHRDLTISFDYFNTRLFHSIIVDQERDSENIYIYESDKKSYTNSYQVDLTWNPVKNLDIFMTFRYTDSRYTIQRANGEFAEVERPLTSQFKTLLNIQYATHMRKWIFDFTAQINGRSRIPTQTGNLEQSTYSPRYPMFYAQVSRRIKHWEIYLGCENIGNYTQKNPILNYKTPYTPAFNSSCVWGPLMGRKFYLGIRFNLY